MLGLQTKLAISEPGDRYEQEADRIADQVMRMSNVEVGAEIPSVTPVQRQSVQRDVSSAQAPIVTPSIQSKIEGLLRSGGEPLPEDAREFMEPRLGRDLSGVRIHRHVEANDLAANVKAKAFAVGSHIVFASGQFLSTNVNNKLLAHELIHTLQQQAVGRSVIQRTPEDEPSSRSRDIESHDVAMEEQPNQIPSEDLIMADSELEKQLNRLNFQMETVLRALFGEQRGDEDIFGSDVSEGQLKKARRVVSRYRRITRILEGLPQLDIAFTAKWLDVFMFTVQVLRQTLKELSASGEVGALIAEGQDRQLRRIFHSARKLRSKKVIKRGARLARAAEAASQHAQRAELQGRLPEALAKITSDTQLQTVGLSDIEIDIEIQQLQSRKRLEIDSVKIQVLDAVIAGLQSGKVQDRGSAEPSFSERADDLVKQADENWARLAQEVVDHYSDNERNLFITELVLERIPEDDKAEFSRAFYDAISKRVDAEQKFQLLQQTRSGQAILAAMSISVDLDFDYFRIRSALGLDVSQGLANREISEKASSLLAEVTPRKAPALSLTLPETADLAVDVAVPGLGVHEIAIVTGSTAINVEGPVDGIFVVTVAPSDLKAVGVMSPINYLEANDTVRIFLPKQRQQVVIPVSLLGKFVAGERVKALISAVEAASLAVPGPRLAPVAKAVVSPLLRGAVRLGPKARSLGRKLGEPLLAGVLETGLPLERLGTGTATRAPVEALEKATFREASAGTRIGTQAPRIQAPAPARAPSATERLEPLSGASAGPDRVTLHPRAKTPKVETVRPGSQRPIPVTSAEPTATLLLRQSRGRLRDSKGGLDQLFSRLSSQNPFVRIGAEGEFRQLRDLVDDPNIADIEYIKSSSAGRSTDVKVTYTSGRVEHIEFRTTSSTRQETLTLTIQQKVTTSSGASRKSTQFSEKGGRASVEFARATREQAIKTIEEVNRLNKSSSKLKQTIDPNVEWITIKVRSGDFQEVLQWRQVDGQFVLVE